MNIATDITSYYHYTVAHIINLSIMSGAISDDLKMARVVPIYKKNSKNDASNYRPVSVLSIISTVFERIIYNQLNVHRPVTSQSNIPTSIRF